MSAPLNIPTDIVEFTVSHEAFAVIQEALANPAKPTEALKRLMGFKQGVIIELPFPPASLSGSKRRRFSAEEVAYLQANYRSIVEAGLLGDLSKQMGRSRSVLSEKARALGLTDNLAAKRIASKAAKGCSKWKDNPHPRGFQGKKHSPEAREAMSEASNAFWSATTGKRRDEHVSRVLQAAIAKNGRIGPITANRGSSWKAGWRDIADKRHYFRSRWEANYARYLQWLKERGDILDWEYEPETFWFDKIKRGVRSYLPDFRVHELNGSKPLHEVKGWMDARSKTTLKRMAKYHPQETIILIREKDYKALSRFSALIGEWE